MTTAGKVTGRWLVAGYLNIGDLILYGKFKNARGRITGFGKNEKGDPTVIIQPVDKDGNAKKGQPKELVMLKVRKIEPEQKEATEDQQAAAKSVEELPEGWFIQLNRRGMATEFVLYDDRHRELGGIRMIPTTDCGGAWMITHSQAPHGWGPLLYDLALEWAGPHGAVPDRHQVSGEARGVWTHYLKNRRSELEFYYMPDHPEYDGCPLHGNAMEDEDIADFHFIKKTRDVLPKLKAKGLLRDDQKVATEFSGNSVVVGADMDIASRVVTRFARGLDLGKTWENGKVRVHRYRNVFHIWDLTNAGKRGKNVRTLSAAPPYSVDPDQWMEEQSKRIVLNAAGGYDTVKKYLDGVEADTSESTERGVDVRPGNVREIKLQWIVGEDQLRVTATPKEFLLNSSKALKHPKTGDPIGRQDTLYYPKGKRDSAVFYRWLIDGGEAKIQRMEIDAIRKLWDQIKVKYDYH